MVLAKKNSTQSMCGGIQRQAFLKNGLFYNGCHEHVSLKKKHHKKPHTLIEAQKDYGVAQV